MKAKRFFSALLVVMMLVSCFAISASADAIKDTNEPVSLTINLWQAKDGDTTAASSATYSHDGADGTVPTGYEGINGSVFTITNKDDSTITATGTTSDNGSVTFTTYGESSTPLPQGRYTVTNKSTPAIQNGTVASFEVDLPMTNPDGTGWIYNVNVYPKMPTNSGTPTISKQVKNSTGDFGEKANIDKLNGEAATWKIEAFLPVDIINYSKYEITDVIGNEDLNVATNISVKFYKATGDSTGADLTNNYTLTEATEANGNTITVALKNFASLTDYSGGKVVITFDTTLKTAGKLIPNDTELTYNNNPTYDSANDTKIDNNGGDPDDEPTTEPGKDDPTDPDSETHTADPYVWTGLIDVLKVGLDATSTPLTGAKFVLLDSDGDVVKSTNISNQDATTGYITVDSDGKITINGLVDSKYTLREVVAPAGYELLGQDIEITINETNLKGSIGTITNVSQNSTTGTITVTDPKSTNLPLTGGMGVCVFAILGLALVAIGGVSAYKTRKSN